VIAFSVFRTQPKECQICEFLDLAVARAGSGPRYTVTDQGPQFGEAFRRWCAHRGVRPRFGAIGKHGSIAVIERFIGSLKREGLRRILLPFDLAAMRLETASYVNWYNEHRPHQALQGATPIEVYSTQRPANRKARLEPRARYPSSGPCAAPQAPVSGKPGCKLKLVVRHVDGQKHLPIVTLRKAA
jgi:hypothetical protein